MSCEDGRTIEVRYAAVGRSPVAGLCRSATGLYCLESAASSMWLRVGALNKVADLLTIVKSSRFSGGRESVDRCIGSEPRRPTGAPANQVRDRAQGESCHASQGVPSLLDSVAYVTDALHWRWGRRHADGASCRRGAVNQGMLTGTLDDDESERAGERESGSPLVFEILLRGCSRPFSKASSLHVSLFLFPTVLRRPPSLVASVDEESRVVILDVVKKSLINVDQK